MSSSPTVQLKGLTKRIGNKTIVRDLSFDIQPGEVFGFLGPNGAGKTTTIRMMVGLTSISEGDVIIKGTSIKENFKKSIAHVGGIVENPEMYKFMTGMQNLKHYARMSGNVSDERMNEIVKLVDLEDSIHTRVKKYSLGMRQRLGIAQALLHNPSVLILDEPTNGLDPAGIREIRDYLRKLAKDEGLSVVVSSHLLSEMEMMCDRIGIIQKGELIDVQNVKSFVSDKATIRTRLTLEPAQDGKAVLEQAGYEVIVDEETLVIETEREQIPGVIQLLVQNQIAIYEAKTEVGTLEDRFLELTGTGGQA
ncbi:bacitracin ABC transporter ATP-binding protein [Pontibacillus halophilus JSM 076056 = DSM 19796]|uniref:Bacitracin ABC transporter ATP-binding protein n=1 Tax=Pontibacillus halophilus JSM 076056 = DSM 19796 TaxID=1385510 RepID=A0A0A5GKE6_9BACI|nr:ABC transporter ATP-binding protein [Pontibacillus halophilus]KGX92454.1 bacitracin ABC transporter ATP-binding protein [Pontibacillus halophilus JSM 076056 = DSM 19796]